jgi:hypothetical protein
VLRSLESLRLLGPLSPPPPEPGSELLPSYWKGVWRSKDRSFQKLRPFSMIAEGVDDGDDADEDRDRTGQEGT